MAADRAARQDASFGTFVRRLRLRARYTRLHVRPVFAPTIGDADPFLPVSFETPTIDSGCSESDDHRAFARTTERG